MNKASDSANSIHCFGLKFTPKLLPTLLTLCLFTLFCSLGVWQYQRAQFKKELIAQFTSRQHAKPLTINDIHDATQLEYYPLTVRGFLDTEHEILVENKFYQHHVGFEVLTPMVLQDLSIILINRGWIDKPPKLTIANGKTTVTGIIHTLPEKVFQIGQAQTDAYWPKFIQNNSWREIKRVMPNRHIHPYVLVLQAGAPLSFTPIYKPSVMPPEKHLGYAFQWFAMALALLVIFIAVNAKKLKSD